MERRACLIFFFLLCTMGKTVIIPTQPLVMFLQANLAFPR